MHLCICVYMFVCMYVCMYVCVYVCMYVCVCMYVYMCVCMYVCMYVCMCAISANVDLCLVNCKTFIPEHITQAVLTCQQSSHNLNRLLALFSFCTEPGNLQYDLYRKCLIRN